MDNLKICFVGVGSIAKRHIKNIQTICKNRGIALTIDAFRRNLDMVDGIDRVYNAFDHVPNDYDVIFITNPTEFHLETLKQFHNRGKNFFIEKPVVSLDQLEEAKKFQLRSDTIYYVAAPLRYNAVIQWIKDNVDLNDIISVRSISSSYLPDWRPGQNYRDTYSAHRNMGGGVSTDLIHEWDYLTFLFDWPERVHSFIGKKSFLEIDSDDYAIYIAEFENKIAEVHLDYFGRKTIREIQLFTKDETVIGDIANNKIRFLVTGEEIDFCEKRDDFQKRELSHFLDMMLGICEAEDGYHHGLDVLNLTQGNVFGKNTEGV